MVTGLYKPRDRVQFPAGPPLYFNTCFAASKRTARAQPAISPFAAAFWAAFWIDCFSSAVTGMRISASLRCLAGFLGRPGERFFAMPLL